MPVEGGTPARSMPGAVTFVEVDVDGQQWSTVAEWVLRLGSLAVAAAGIRHRPNTEQRLSWCPAVACCRAARADSCGSPCSGQEDGRDRY